MIMINLENQLTDQLTDQTMKNIQLENTQLKRKIYINFVFLYKIFKLPIPYYYDNISKQKILNEKMEDLIMLNEIQKFIPQNYFINKLLIKCLSDLYKFINLNNKLSKNKIPVYKKFNYDIIDLNYPKHKFLYCSILIMFILNIILYICYLNYEN